jgi:hypothetical protein
MCLVSPFRSISNHFMTYTISMLIFLPKKPKDTHPDNRKCSAQTSYIITQNFTHDNSLHIITENGAYSSIQVNKLFSIKTHMII